LPHPYLTFPVKTQVADFQASPVWPSKSQKAKINTKDFFNSFVMGTLKTEGKLQKELIS
jgi:hypothetical protein